MEIYLQEQEGYGSGTQFFNNYPNGWSAYMRAIMRGYNGSYGNFAKQYNDKYFNSLSSGNEEGSTPMTFTWHTWKDYSEIVDGVVHIIAEKIQQSVTVQISVGSSNLLDNDMNSNRKRTTYLGNIILGSSIDFTISAGSGYNIEGGYFISSNGIKGKPFWSHGTSFGSELSSGWNFLLVIPKNNFSFSDLEGLSTNAVYNFGPISISIFGNSKVGYPSNSTFETYYGFKIGLGIGFGGSYSPNSQSTFFHWIPDISKSFFHWR